MGKKRRRRFTDEYNQDVIRMLEEKQIPISKLASDMDLRVDLLYSWEANMATSTFEALQRTNQLLN